MEQHEISKAVIRRLPRYYRYLGDLMDAGVERISSAELSAKMNVTASQIRQDLNNFGGFGQQGYGYNVKYLYNEIAKILGLDNVHNLVIIGAGKLGQAIANYSSFEKRGFIIKAMFDNNKDYFGRKVGNIEIMDVNLLADYLTKNNIDIAAITVPKEAVNPIADILVKCGIKSVWNFAPVDLELPEGIIVENVHLLDSLMQLSYNLTEYEHTR
ncbi:MAG: redox-sensing transcriptional repressor Rex [Lachnospiraceae bacterium]|nr:redox-sensing transcriptional repressor Rex [Lachnospiraceae bacterium]